MKQLCLLCHGAVLSCLVGFAVAQPAAIPNSSHPVDSLPNLRRQGPHDSPPLSARFTNAFVPGRNRHAMPDLSQQEVAAADRFARQHAAQFGAAKLVPPRIGLTRRIRRIASGATGGGTWSDLQDGRKLWTTAIRSPKAQGLRLHFSQFNAGEQTVRVYARSGDEIIERGSYTGLGPNQSGEFWAATLPGDEVFVELVGDGPRPAAFAIDEILHFDQPIYGLAPAVGPTSPVLACHLEPACQPPGLHPAAVDASVLIGNVIRYNDGSGPAGIAKYCSATMLKDLDDTTQVPYLITAFHCLSTQQQADSLEVIFRYQRNVCGGAMPSLFSLPYSIGATLLQSNPTEGGNDMAFLRLNPIQQLAASDPPLQFAEWSMANGLTDPSYGIHHPGGGNYFVPGVLPNVGDPSGHAKRVTYFEPSSYLFCDLDTGSDGDYFLANATAGAIQKGSSGSGLFDFNGRFLGQLWATCELSIFPDPDRGHCADEDGWRAVYGKFWVSYAVAGVGRWMEIGGTINVNRSYDGTELGTPSQPFNTVTEGYNLAWDNTRIKMQAGNYSDRLTLDKRVTLVADLGPVTIGQ